MPDEVKEVMVNWKVTLEQRAWGNLQIAQMESSLGKRINQWDLFEAMRQGFQAQGSTLSDDARAAAVLLDAYKNGDKLMRQQLGEVLNVWKVKSKKAESEVLEDERQTRIPKKAAGRRI